MAFRTPANLARAGRRGRAHSLRTSSCGSFVRRHLRRSAAFRFSHVRTLATTACPWTTETRALRSYPQRYRSAARWSATPQCRATSRPAVTAVKPVFLSMTSPGLSAKPVSLGPTQGLTNSRPSRSEACESRATARWRGSRVPSPWLPTRTPRSSATVARRAYAQEALTASTSSTRGLEGAFSLTGDDVSSPTRCGSTVLD